MRIPAFFLPAALLSIASAFLFPAESCSQQSNLLALIPPSAEFSRERSGDFSLGWLSMQGARTELSGQDVTVIFGERTSTGTYRTAAFGASLLGAIGEGEGLLGGLKKDFSGLTLHAAPAWYRLVAGGKWHFLFSFPVSFGNYGYGNGRKEEVVYYNFLLGPEAGAGAALRAGSFSFKPSALVGVLAGYKEKYKGEVYWDNISNSGWVRPFPVLTLKADLDYLPGEARLSCAYQRYYGNGRDRAADVFMVRLMQGWGGWGRYLKSEKKPG